MSRRSTSIPEKSFFKIGEVSELVGVKAHVLRYWESEFPALRPMKTRGSHRVYRRRDVETAMAIRRLLHDEGYTISGARKKLRADGREQATGGGPDRGAVRELELRAELLAIREELTALLTRLDGIEHRERTEDPAVVRVEQVVPTPVMNRRR